MNLFNTQQLYSTDRLGYHNATSRPLLFQWGDNSALDGFGVVHRAPWDDASLLMWCCSDYNIDATAYRGRWCISVR